MYHEPRDALDTKHMEGMWTHTDVEEVLAMRLHPLQSRTTPDGVWHRDSHHWRKFIGGGTQDTDFEKGVIGRMFTKFLRRRNRGGQGHSDPLMKNELGKLEGLVYRGVHKLRILIRGLLSDFLRNS